MKTRVKNHQKHTSFDIDPTTTQTTEEGEGSIRNIGSLISNWQEWKQ